MISNYVILTFCILILLAYLFDISFKYSRIPGVVLLIGMGILLQIAVSSTNLKIPNLRPILPILGTLGLILIVMDAALEIKLERSKAKSLAKGVLSAVLLLIAFVTILTIIVVTAWDQPVKTTLLNVIPLGIISSSVAISSAVLLSRNQREFITLESAISDIFGILVFDFILLNEGSIGSGLISFGLKGLITIFIAALMTTILALMLHRTQYHVSYIIILTSVVLIYILAKLIHLPGLFLVVVFGLALSNNSFVENTSVNRFVNFEKFREDINSFKKILAELTFLVRSFFFIMFGFYTSLAGFLNINNLLFAAAVTAGIFILRWIFLLYLLGKETGKLIWFAPRGLITILLFLSIPEALRLELINEEVVTLVILMSIFVMMIGNMIPARNENRSETTTSSTVENSHHAENSN
ncbi:MAG: cation:proton antiporter [Bacteroidia bacterium]|nr:cation:proton antiporter [Bacteroidia bacterium]